MTEQETLEKIVKERFGIHRGLSSKDHPENSLGAIEAAIALEPFMVEFDVVLADGVVRSGHPPHGPMDRLDEILSLFSGVKTYPKVDLWLNTSPDSSLIDLVLADLKLADLPFVLLAPGHLEPASQIMDAQCRLAQRIRDNPKVRLNIERREYRETGAEAVDRHIARLGPALFSISPEIHRADWEETARFAVKHRVKQIHFWLWGPPDIPNPRVSEVTVRKALALEEQYPFKVYFDINPIYIEGFVWSSLAPRPKRGRAGV